MKQNKVFFIILFFALCYSMHSGAQLPQAVVMDHLVLDENKSDEFSGSSLDTLKWWWVDACNFTDSIKHGFNWGGSAFFKPENVLFASGNLLFKADYNPDS